MFIQVLILKDTECFTWMSTTSKDAEFQNEHEQKANRANDSLIHLEV